MAEVVSESELNEGRGFNVVAYDWSLWLNGQTWKAARGVDYQCTSGSFAASVYSTAKRKGLKVKIKKHEDHVVFCAKKPKDGSLK